jgi:endo-1,4-beta-xylanase
MILHWFRLRISSIRQSKRTAAVLLSSGIAGGMAFAGCAGDEYSRTSSKVQASEGGAATVGVDTEVTFGGSDASNSYPGADGGALTLVQGGAPTADKSTDILASSAGAAGTTDGTAAAGANALLFAVAGTTATAGSSGAPTGGIAGARSVGGRSGSGVAGAASTFTLRDAAAVRQLWIGAAMASYISNDAAYFSVAASEFNYLTPENEMKWTATEPTPNGFTFTGADKLVTFAQEHQMQVKGHTLVWHSQLPVWVQSLTTADEVRQAMTNHIQTVAGHFRGKLLAWDVVNEAIDDASGNPLRASVFQQKLGNTYIDEAFSLAHQADPTALLFYNDYGIEGMSNKANAAYALVKRLKSAGVPIDGVGLQMHIGGTGSPTAADVIANMKRIAQLGLLVNISELDVNLCAIAGDQTTKFTVQQQRYYEIVAACVAEPMCHGITLWGVSDKYSWLNSVAACTKTGQTGSPWPLLWDTAYVKKPAWAGIMNALLGT